jgi:hypothetical protein
MAGQDEPMPYLPLSHDLASWLGWLHFKARSGFCYFGTMQLGNEAGRLLLLWLMSREDRTPALSIQQFSLALKASPLSPASCTNLFQQSNSKPEWLASERLSKCQIINNTSRPPFQP